MCQSTPFLPQIKISPEIDIVLYNKVRQIASTALLLKMIYIVNPVLTILHKQCRASIRRTRIYGAKLVHTLRELLLRISPIKKFAFENPNNNLSDVFISDCNILGFPYVLKFFCSILDKSLIMSLCHLECVFERETRRVFFILWIMKRFLLSAKRKSSHHQPKIVFAIVCKWQTKWGFKCKHGISSLLFLTFYYLLSFPYFPRFHGWGNQMSSKDETGSIFLCIKLWGIIFHTTYKPICF